VRRSASAVGTFFVIFLDFLLALLTNFKERFVFVDFHQINAKLKPKLLEVLDFALVAINLEVIQEFLDALRFFESFNFGKHVFIELS
jgi:hypothetical protein